MNLHSMEYLEIPCCNGTAFKIKVREVVHKRMSPYQDIAVYDTEPFGKCLFLDNVIQCSESDHGIYDSGILKMLSKGDRRLLILGGGDGYVAEMALQINPSLKITVVDLDMDVINVCKSYMSQEIFEDARVTLIVDDVFNFMKHADSLSYDGMICDLTDLPVGYDDAGLLSFYSKVFSSSNEILRDTGWIGVYAGCRNGVLSSLLRKFFSKTEYSRIFVQSFGEPTFMLHGKK